MSAPAVALHFASDQLVIVVPNVHADFMLVCDVSGVKWVKCGTQTHTHKHAFCGRS